ncbi:unnamed protein product [Amoebophrya sp. A25]|nr:unnamed protein product [Amoebophrya sp. A25]|eukprot:GSA25T00005372001.1
MNQRNTNITKDTSAGAGQVHRHPVCFTSGLGVVWWKSVSHTLRQDYE